MGKNMDHKEVGQYWNKNAPKWTKMAREGKDFYRDHFNTPAFLEILPDVSGLRGLDIGCGEGYNTRKLVELGARMTAIDISEVFIQAAHNFQSEGKKIDHLHASAVELPFSRESFDFCTGFMSLMDIPENDLVLREAYRILKPGGFMQFSISHPCYETPHRKKLLNSDGKAYAYEIGGYFDKVDGSILVLNDSWRRVEAGCGPIEIPRFHKTLSQWVHAILAVGFAIEHLNEPCPSEEQLGQEARLQDATVISYFLHLRVRKQ
jgi:ubiquinone/menaquinone biosynthesis C-methylase UbiE